MCSSIGGASPETSQNSRPSTTAVRTGVRPWQLGSKSTSALRLGRRAQRAVERVRPGVVGALEAAHLALRASTRRAPRWRQTLWKPRGRPSSSPTKSRFSPPICRVTNAPRSPTIESWPTHTQPPQEEVLRLPGGHGFVREGARGQHRGLEQRAAGRSELRFGERASWRATYHDFVRLTTRSGSHRLPPHERDLGPLGPCRGASRTAVAGATTRSSSAAATTASPLAPTSPRPACACACSNAATSSAARA